MVAKFFLTSLALLLTMELVASKPDSCGGISKIDTGLAAIFTQIYMYTLAAYKPWTEIFNVSFPISFADNRVHNITYLDIPKYYNVTDDQASKVADEVEESVNNTFSVQTPCFLGNVLGLAVAYDLIDADILTQDNVVDMALSYANQTREEFETGPCESNFDCLTKGFFDFLESTGDLLKENSDQITANSVKAFMQVYEAFTGDGQN